ncbi:MAG: acyl-CoA thioesterase [Verrucomicrobiales bacterium]|jgi:acyl-CoA thioesterase
MDPSAQLLGIELIHAGDGRARFEMTVREDMANGHGMCHGGIIFLLGDTVMDYATNVGNPLSVAVHAEVDFVSPAHVGDRLVAEGGVQDTWGRKRLVDVTVTNMTTGKDIAHFRGRTQEIRR